MEIAIGVGIGFGVAAFLGVVLLIARAGSTGRAVWGLTVAGRAAHNPELEAKVNAVLAGAPVPDAGKPAAPPAPPKPSGVPLRLLALLQAESRLVDFLMEDVQAATDAQIGQAVREVHRKAREALTRVATIVPVMPDDQDATVTVPKGFDPSAVRVLGNVTGEPPFTGQLQHPGWRVKELKLNPPPAAADEFVLQPAEVQIP